MIRSDNPLHGSGRCCWAIAGCARKTPWQGCGPPKHLTHRNKPPACCHQTSCIESWNACSDWNKPSVRPPIRDRFGSQSIQSGSWCKPSHPKGWGLSQIDLPAGSEHEQHQKPRFRLFWLHDPSSRKSSVLESCTSTELRMYSTYAPNLQKTVQTTHIDQKSSGLRMIHVVIKTNNRDFSSFQHIQRDNRRRTELLHHGQIRRIKRPCPPARPKRRIHWTWSELFPSDSFVYDACHLSDTSVFVLSSFTQ